MNYVTLSFQTDSFLLDWWSIWLFLSDWYTVPHCSPFMEWRFSWFLLFKLVTCLNPSVLHCRIPSFCMNCSIKLSHSFKLIAYIHDSFFVDLLPTVHTGSSLWTEYLAKWFHVIGSLLDSILLNWAIPFGLMVYVIIPYWSDIIHYSSHGLIACMILSFQINPSF